MKLDTDKEIVQVVAIIAAAVVVVAAMLFDGKVGDAIGTVILTGSTAVISYYAGQKRSGNVAETTTEQDQYV